MIKTFQRGLDDIATIDVGHYYSFISIGKENIEQEKGFTVKSFLVRTTLDCQTFLDSKTGKGWRLKIQ